MDANPITLNTEGLVPGGLPATTPVTEPHQNFFIRNLPTIGALVAGAAAPFTGGSSLLLDAALMGGGAALGQTGKDIFSGQAPGTDVLKEGALNTAGGFLGGAVGKAAGGLLSNVAPKVFDRLGSGFLTNQFNGKLAPDIAKTFYKGGLNTTDQVSNVIPQLAGTNSFYERALQRALADAGDEGHVVNLVGPTSLTDTAANALFEHGVGAGKSVVDSVGNSVTQAINKAVGSEDIKYVPGVAGKAGTFVYTPGALKNVLPSKALQAARALQNLSSKAYKVDQFGNFRSPNDEITYKVLSSVANDIKNRVFQSGGASIPLSENARTILSQGLENLSGTNPKLAQTLAESLPTSARGLASAQAPWVQASDALNALTSNAQRGGGLSLTGLKDAVGSGRNTTGILTGVGGATALGPLGAALGLLPIFLGSDIGEKAGATVASKTAGALSKNAVSKGAETAGLLSSIPVTTALGPNNTAGGDISSPMATNQNAGGVQSGGNMQTPESNIFSSLLGAGSPQQEPLAMQALLSMFAPMLLNSGVEGNASAASSNIQRAQTAASVLPVLEQEFGAAGGAQGPIKGLLSQIAAKFTGGPAGAFPAQSSQAAAQISAATGVPVQDIMRFMPQITQNQQTAQLNMSQLNNILSALGTRPTTGPSVLGSLVPAQ